MIDVETDLRYASKHVRVRETLRRQIEEEIYRPNDKIPCDAEIMKEFGVSRITVLNAIKDLVNEKLLVRTVPKGTFVADGYSASPGKLIALFMQTEGHLYAEMSGFLIGVLQNHGYCPTVFDPNLIAESALRKKLRSILRMDFERVVVYGYAAFPFDILHKETHDYRRIIFLTYCETSLEFPGSSKVLTDYQRGGFLAVKHLLDRGHRRILLSAHKPEPKPYHVIHLFLKGCRQAYSMAGLDDGPHFSVMEWDPDGKTDEGKLVSILSHKQRPTAVFCLGDSHAKDVFAAATRLGLSIPEDLAVIGYGNTPWCQHFPIPLTSVSMELEHQAKIVAEVITGERKPGGEPIIVPPKLVVRASGGAEGGQKKLSSACASRHA